MYEIILENVSKDKTVPFQVGSRRGHGRKKTRCTVFIMRWIDFKVNGCLLLRYLFVFSPFKEKRLFRGMSKQCFWQMKQFKKCVWPHFLCGQTCPNAFLTSVGISLLTENVQTVANHHADTRTNNPRDVIIVFTLWGNKLPLSADPCSNNGPMQTVLTWEQGSNTDLTAEWKCRMPPIALWPVARENWVKALSDCAFSSQF